MNYTWQDIILIDFINASKGDLSAVSKNRELNKDTFSVWCTIQDEYIKTMDSESIDVKRYKSTCFKYATKLREFILNPDKKTKLFTEVNALFMEKERLANLIFSDEEVKWDENIAKVTSRVGIRIIDTEIRAKEFFNLIKVL